MNIEKEFESVLNCIEKHEELYAEYEKINNELRALQGDFYTDVQMTDRELPRRVLEMADNILFRLTGFEEMASYYLFDAPKKGGWVSNGENKYSWSNFGEFKNAIFEMVADKRKERK